jgi:YebC/PmpR family DNA-binding regulatory protein
MAGHSKWAQIKRKKAVTDARRGQLFTKLLKEISVAARLGGGDQSGNARLRVAVQEARSSNVPNDNIERAIKKGTGELEGVRYEDVSYEGYGPSGVAILIEAVTDNRNRTVAELRHLFSRNGGNLGENGCVAWMFDQRGYFAIDRDSISEEQFMEIAIELEVDDVATEDDAFEMFTAPERFAEVREGLEKLEVKTSTGQLARLPQNYVKADSEKVPQILRLIESLEDQDDVQNVWANFDIDDEVLAAQAG